MPKPGTYETINGEQYQLENGATPNIIVFIYRGIRMQVKKTQFKTTPVRHFILAIESHIEANDLCNIETQDK